MSRLRERITAQGATAAGDYHPHGTGATPMMMPLAAITHQVTPSGHAVYYEQLQPLITTDGAIIPAHSGGRHADVIPAGRT